MDYLNTCFYDEYDGIFNEYLSHIDFQFEQLIPEYAEFSIKEEEILSKYPVLRKVVDDREENKLSISEVQALIDIFDIRDKKLEMFMRLIFFKGYKEAYYFFKEIGLLKQTK